MKTLEIVVNNLTKAYSVAEKYDVEFEPMMVGEMFSKLAIIRGEEENLIAFVNEFFINAKVRPFYIAEISA